MVLLGAHVGIGARDATEKDPLLLEMAGAGKDAGVTGGLHLAPARARALECESFQIFSRNQRQWRAPPLTAAHVELWNQALKRADYDPSVVFIHGSYLINPAGAPERLEAARGALLVELQRAEALGVLGVAFHPGSHLGAGTAAGLERLVGSIAHALDGCPGRAMLLPEGMAGQGNILGSKLEELAAAVAQFPKGRVGVALDTCHLFAAGYDLVNRYDDVMDEVDDRIGLDRVRAWHLNDSEMPLGSCRDRHELIGKGALGLEPFRALVNDPRFATVPSSLETDEDAYADDLATLRRLRTDGRKPAKRTRATQGR